MYFFACYNTTMKLTRTFNITSDEFYDYLEEQVLNNIQKSSKRKVEKSAIKKGLTYDSKPAQCKVTIDEYKRGSVYQSTMRSMTSFIRVTYHTEETKDGLKIDFEQFVSGHDDELDHKNFIVRSFYQWISFGRMSRTLYDMRNDILNKREGIQTFHMPQPERHKALRSFLQKKFGDKDETN